MYIIGLKPLIFHEKIILFSIFSKNKQQMEFLNNPKRKFLKLRFSDKERENNLYLLVTFNFNI